jgi:hypothetical protein
MQKAKKKNRPYLPGLVEINKNLHRCLKMVFLHNDKPSLTPEGTITHEVPPPMTTAWCPKNKSKASLCSPGDEPAPKPDPKTKKIIGIEEKNIRWACYRYETTLTDKLVNGEEIKCHAWSDLDCDGKAAHWVLTFTRNEKCVKKGSGQTCKSRHQVSKIIRDKKSDDL